MVERQDWVKIDLGEVWLEVFAAGMARHEQKKGYRTGHEGKPGCVTHVEGCAGEAAWSQWVEVPWDKTLRAEGHNVADFPHDGTEVKAVSVSAARKGWGSGGPYLVLFPHEKREGARRYVLVVVDEERRVAWLLGQASAAEVEASYVADWKGKGARYAIAWRDLHPVTKEWSDE